MIVQEKNYLQHDSFLEHYGVPGMKWGVRKNRAVVSAKNAYKKAKKDYSKAFDTAYGHSARHLISQYFGKNKKISDKNWNKVGKASENLQKTKKAYKEAKKTAKAEYKAKYKKALSDNKKALKENKKKYLSTADKSDKIFDSSYKKAYNQAIKSGAKKSTAEQAGYDAAMKYAGAYNKKVKAEYKKTKKKLKQDRYFIKNIGV